MSANPAPSFNTTGTMSEQRRLVYYADPQTRLPVYEEMVSAPPRDNATGQPDPARGQGYKLYRSELYFDRELIRYDDRDLTPVTISWPREQ